MGQAPVIHYMPMLFKMITEGELDPTEIVSHKMRLDQASEAYQIFNDHEDGCVKVVLKPWPSQKVITMFLTMKNIKSPVGKSVILPTGLFYAKTAILTFV